MSARPARRVLGEAARLEAVATQGCAAPRASHVVATSSSAVQQDAEGGETERQWAGGGQGTRILSNR